MSTAMPDLITALHHSFRQIAGESTAFTEVWERHTSLVGRVTERLVADFQLSDLGQIVDRHADLFRLVDRASQISAPRLPANSLGALHALAEAVDAATNADPLVHYVRSLPGFARTIQEAISAQNVSMVRPLTVALGLVAGDETSLWSLTDVFAPHTAELPQ